MTVNTDILNKGNNESVSKREKQEEMTRQVRYFTPPADIFENQEAILLELEVPGVTKNEINVSLEKGVLSIEAKIDPKRYEGFKPLYTEYNVGHYARKFEVSERIDSDKISAGLANGILTITLPKAEEAKPKKIEIK